MNISVRPMTAEASDLEMFRVCFTKHDSPKRSESLRWQYAANPTGKTFVDFAVADDGRLAAIYATLPARYRIDGNVELGVQSVDTITDSDFRGRGLFLKLAKSTYARAHEAGSKLVYGFPNGNSAHGFFERLEWKKLDPVPFLIRPLRTSFVLEKLKLSRYAKYVPDLPLYIGLRRTPRRYRVEEITRFDSRVTELWADFAANVRIAVERDDRYLNWRLFDKPGETYKNLGLFEGDRLLALISYIVKDKHDGRVGYLMEALCVRGAEARLRDLLRVALTDMMKQRADVVLAWCLPHSSTYSSLLRAGFMPFPEKYRPIELHFGARAFDPKLAPIVENRSNWYVSYLDSDTV